MGIQIWYPDAVFKFKLGLSLYIIQVEVYKWNMIKVSDGGILNNLREQIHSNVQFRYREIKFHPWVNLH